MNAWVRSRYCQSTVRDLDSVSPEKWYLFPDAVNCVIFEDRIIPDPTPKSVKFPSASTGATKTRVTIFSCFITQPPITCVLVTMRSPLRSSFTQRLLEWTLCSVVKKCSHSTFLITHQDRDTNWQHLTRCLNLFFCLFCRSFWRLFLRGCRRCRTRSLSIDLSILCVLRKFSLRAFDFAACSPWNAWESDVYLDNSNSWSTSVFPLQKPFLHSAVFFENAHIFQGRDRQLCTFRTSLLPAHDRALLEETILHLPSDRSLVYFCSYAYDLRILLRSYWAQVCRSFTVVTS